MITSIFRLRQSNTRLYEKKLDSKTRGKLQYTAMSLSKVDQCLNKNFNRKTKITTILVFDLWRLAGATALWE